MAPGLIVAAPASGSGKTVVTLGLLRALRRRGVAVAAFKVGPDFIDPAFHRAASGRACRNLDPWAMRPETLAEALASVGAGAELVIGEGVMGLYDGAIDGSGSTADLAERLGLPVLLVLDVAGQAASAAAVLLGFRSYRPGLTIAGVVTNRVGGARHRQLLEQALAPLGTPLIGQLPREAALVQPSRHLGLVQAEEREDLESFLEQAADLVEANLDLDALRELARAPVLPTMPAEPSPPLPPLGQRIAVARDIAFAFAYDGMLEGWRRAGAELLPFSPLADEAPAADADAVYLPGGYPELHAERIAASHRFLDGLHHRAEADAAIYGECGGYMVLGEGLIDAEGHRHRMAGLLPLKTSFQTPRLHLGYRRVEALADSPLAAAGGRLRGHEFHYATVLSEGGVPALFRATDALGEGAAEVGLRNGRVMGSFLHLIDGE
jgi:cobyrinic acid a,c-diamide synthase